MALYVTASYQVKPAAVDRVKRAIDEFVAYVRENEPGTRLYLAWQQEDDPTRFFHFFIFADAEAQAIHSRSSEVRAFESVYGPELAGGPVRFTRYESVAGKLEPV